MRLKNGSFADFAEEVKAAGKQIIVYGAGMNGKTLAVYWLNQYQLLERVACYVDADKGKQGKEVRLGKYTVPIKAPPVLEELTGTYVLLMTVNDFEPVISVLTQMRGMEYTEVYFLPIMIMNAERPSDGCGVIQTSKEPLIPKVIHYTWFSGEPVPDHLKRCIDTWKRFCPDYDIVRWDSTNYDLWQNQYMTQAFQHQKWGFIADVARLDILYRYGGIYLDSDVELVRNLDELLYQPAFCSVERWGTVNMGGGSGAQPGNPVIKAMLDYRKDEPFVLEDGSLNLMSCGYYETPPLIEKGLQINGQTQLIADGMMAVYSSDYFHPYEYMNGKLRVTKNTFSIHHFDGGWMNPAVKAQRMKEQERLSAFIAKMEGGEAFGRTDWGASFAECDRSGL